MYTVIWAKFNFIVIAILLTVFDCMAAQKPPVVVELFTSQGCSSCPPAEAYLQELSKRKDIIALEFHVEYWDYIGWKDRFAKRQFTIRQEGYVNSLNAKFKYTPQMIVGGVTHMVGSDRNAVEAEIARQKRIDLDRPSIEIRQADDIIKVNIGNAKVHGDYDVVLITFDKDHVTRVKRGENRGRTSINSRVVRYHQNLGKWDGESVDLRISLVGRPGDGGCAVFLQNRNYGKILTAASLTFN